MPVGYSALYCSIRVAKYFFYLISDLPSQEFGIITTVAKYKSDMAKSQGNIFSKLHAKVRYILCSYCSVANILNIKGCDGQENSFIEESHQLLTTF